MKNNDGRRTDGLGMILSFVWPRHHFERNDSNALPNQGGAAHRTRRPRRRGARVRARRARAAENVALIGRPRGGAGRSRPRARESRVARAAARANAATDDPWRVWLLCALAEAERELGDDACVEEADEHSRLALELAPGSAWPMLVRASVLLARVALSSGARAPARRRGAPRERTAARGRM